MLCPANGSAWYPSAIELQRALNPRGEPKVEKFGTTFSIGDKVIQIENDYDKEAYNGDIGFVGIVGLELGEIRIVLTADRSLMPTYLRPSSTCRSLNQSGGIRNARRNPIEAGKRRSIEIAETSRFGDLLRSTLTSWEPGIRQDISCAATIRERAIARPSSNPSKFLKYRAPPKFSTVVFLERFSDASHPVPLGHNRKPPRGFRPPA